MKKYYASITPKSGRGMSINDLIDALEDYKRSFQEKTRQFFNALLDIGISVAESNTGEYGQYIIFEKKITETVDGYVGALIGRDGQKIVRQWNTKEGVDGYEISPILMAEFGSGWLAKVLDNVNGVGQGTMPDAKGHAFNPNGWWWEDEEGKHHSYGEAPTFPMHSAMLGMLFDIDRVAREVFNG